MALGLNMKSEHGNFYCHLYQTLVDDKQKDVLYISHHSPAIFICYIVHGNKNYHVLIFYIIYILIENIKKDNKNIMW